MLESAQTDVVLEATSGVSLKKASKLAKFNNVLDQILAHVQSFNRPNGNAFLETEGVLRQSGNHAEISVVFEQMLGKPIADSAGDPSATPLTNFKSFIQNPHNIIGLLKRMLKEKEYDIPWSKEAQDEFEKFRQSNIDNKTDMSFEQLVKNLISKGLNEEAKALHNLLHLCYQVSSNVSKNKMPASNVAIAIAPSIGPFFDLATDPNTAQLLEDMGQQIKHPISQHVGGGAQFIKAIEHDPNKPGYFSKPFFAVNPEIAADMAKKYEDRKIYPLIIKPVVFLGLKLPMWISKIIRALAPKSPTESAKRASRKEEAAVSTQAIAHEELSTPVSVEPLLNPKQKDDIKRREPISPHLNLKNKKDGMNFNTDPKKSEPNATKKLESPKRKKY